MAFYNNTKDSNEYSRKERCCFNRFSQKMIEINKPLQIKRLIMLNNIFILFLLAANQSLKKYEKLF